MVHALFICTDFYMNYVQKMIKTEETARWQPAIAAGSRARPRVANVHDPRY